MKKNLPIMELVLSYEAVFEQPPPDDRLEFIKNIPKVNLITEIAALNSRLKSFRKLSFKYDLENQFNELWYFCGQNTHLFNVYKPLVNAAVGRNQSTITETKLLLFSRPACLLALQEIILHGNDLPSKGFQMTYDDWDNFIKYYLCINGVAGAFDKSNKKGYSSFEILAANQVFLNELAVVLNPALSLERFSKWVIHLKNDSTLSKYFENYFNPFGFPFEYFLKQICSIFVRHEDKYGSECYFKLGNNDPYFERFFDEFSQRNNQTLGHKWDLSEVRNGPFFKEKAGHYILLDKIFIIEKVYEQFINNFFHKYLVDSEIPYDYYRGQFGGFFEKYIADIFKRVFGPRKNAVLKCLDDLKIKIGKQEHEIADVYIRENKKIFIAQIKSNGLRTDQFSGLPEKLFTDAEGNNSEFLYKNFGLFQLIQSIQFLKGEILKVDSRFPENKRVNIFPALIVNEKLFHTPLFPKIFNEKFKEKLPDDLPKFFTVHPLTIMHVEDLERIEDSLLKKKIDFWKLLRQHFKGSTLDRPFNITLNRHNPEKDFDIKKFTFYEYIDFDTEENDQESVDSNN